MTQEDARGEILSEIISYYISLDPNKRSAIAYAILDDPRLKITVDKKVGSKNEVPCGHDDANYQRCRDV